MPSWSNAVHRSVIPQPTKVLRERQLWPSSLCHDAFLRESTRSWYLRIALLTGWHQYLSEGDGTWALTEMSETWPLPIGREAINRRAAMFEGDVAAYMTSMRLASFEGHEEAMWAIRVTASGSTLHMFGLAERTRGANDHDEGDSVLMGGLRYILRGRDASLMETVRAAERWWAD